MAGFLLITGLSGALLSWYDELDALLCPALLQARPGHGTQHALDPLVLRAKVERAYPEKLANHVPLSYGPGRSAIFYAAPRPGRTGIAEQPVVQVLVHPYTGEVLGDRVLGEWGYGTKYVMPFLYRLHHSLALGTPGMVVLGAIALLWTLDCFLGLWLTLPASTSTRGFKTRAATTGRSWRRRWMPSWTIRWHSGGYKRNFDVHRAGGLWAWAMLLIFAWSSVAFNLTPVYEGLMKKSGLPFQVSARSLPTSSTPTMEPGIGWVRALEIGRRLMGEQAVMRGFAVEREDLLYYDARKAAFSYYVRSSKDAREKVGRTHVVFDANSGTLLNVWLPTGAASGDTLTSWITGLHMADLGGWPFQALVSLMGLMVALLSMTGVVIWSRKRRSQDRTAMRARTDSTK